MNRAEAKDRVLEYFQERHHANLFLTWELKYPLDRQENSVIADEFLDLLEKMGIVWA